ncbi:MAG: N-acetyltransferase [Rhodococcus sp.]|nr:N-acetyltransferase [Rhodococcus sp. (in: high G+C Gram-positive bacteria)]
MTADSNPSVRKSDTQKRYEISVDGTVAGFTEYLDRDQQRIFFHTEIGEEFGGRGLASTLIREALTDTTSSGLRVVPVCPFVARFVEKHDDFDDQVDPATRDHIRAVEALS